MAKKKTRTRKIEKHKFEQGSERGVCRICGQYQASMPHRQKPPKKKAEAKPVPAPTNGSQTTPPLDVSWRPPVHDGSTKPEPNVSDTISVECPTCFGTGAVTFTSDEIRQMIAQRERA